MQYYTYKIEGNEPIQLNVGNHRLHIEWRWNTVAQEQKDNLDRMLLQSAQSDPLMGSAGIVAREYDYLKYYTEVVPQDAAEQEAWLFSQPERNTSFPTYVSGEAIGIFNSKIYVGLWNHGIYVSVDGETFTQNTSFPTDTTVRAFTAFNDKLYVGANSGIYVSEDGETFTQNTSFPTTRAALAFAVFNDKLYVGTNSGIYVSVDGETFTQNTSYPTGATVRAFAVFNDKLYVGTNSGIYVSVDGETFTQNTSYPTSIMALAFAVFNDKLYVGTHTSSPYPTYAGHGIYVSADGETFTQNTSFPTTMSARAFAVFNNKLYVGRDVPPYGGRGIYISEDGSTFFISSPVFTDGINAFAVFDDKLYIGVGNGGIYTLKKSADILPQSILRVGPSTAAALSLLRERVALCTGLKEYNEELLEELHYQALITDENENRTVADVIPGGWFRDQDQYYALNFQSAMERIERDQLSLVTIYFEVYDGE